VPFLVRGAPVLLCRSARELRGQREQDHRVLLTKGAMGRSTSMEKLVCVVVAVLAVLSPLYINRRPEGERDELLYRTNLPIY
jgi:hypothetical protein